MNAIEDCDGQLRAVAGFFDELATRMDRIPPPRTRATTDEQAADALAW